MKSRISKTMLILAITTVALTGIHARSSTSLVKTEIEPEMEIEGWMMDEYFWNNGFFDFAPATDKELAIEAWMYDDAYWM